MIPGPGDLLRAPGGALSGARRLLAEVSAIRATLEEAVARLDADLKVIKADTAHMRQQVDELASAGCGSPRHRPARGSPPRRTTGARHATTGMSQGQPPASPCTSRRRPASAATRIWSTRPDGSTGLRAPRTGTNAGMHGLRLSRVVLTALSLAAGAAMPASAGPTATIARACGKADIGFTSAKVRARHVGCKRARRFVRASSRRKLNCTKKNNYCRVTHFRGYRCVRGGNEIVVKIRCRKGRKVIRESHGD